MKIKGFFHRLWHRIPTKWRSSIIWGAVSLVFSTIITLTRGPGILVEIYLLAFVTAVLLSWLKLANLAMQQFWTHIRGMTITAMLPALLASFQRIFVDPSFANIIDLLACILITIIIWKWFDKIIRRFAFNEKKR